MARSCKDQDAWANKVDSATNGRTHSPKSQALLAFTRYYFTSKLYGGNQSSFYCPPSPAKPTLLQYYCATIVQYTPSDRPPLLCYEHHTIWEMAISRKGQKPSRILRRFHTCVSLHAFKNTYLSEAWVNEIVTAEPTHHNPKPSRMNEARLSHLPFWGPSEAVFFLIKRPSGEPE